MKRKKQSQILGELESEIMDIIWKNKTVSVREVFSQLEKRRKIAYTTVMTVMNRLVGKKILKRRIDESSAYLYCPVKDKELFMADNSKKLINNLINEFGEVAVAQFIDAIEDSDLKDLAGWQRKLKSIKNR